MTSVMFTGTGEQLKVEIVMDIESEISVQGLQTFGLLG